jgi:hypothetical protein
VLRSTRLLPSLLVVISAAACSHAAPPSDGESKAASSTTQAGDDDQATTADELAARLALGPDERTAALLFPSSGAPVVRGSLQPGGHVIVAYALARMKTCRAYHDGFPFWDMRVGGEVLDVSGEPVLRLGEEGPDVDGHKGGSVTRFVDSATGAQLEHAQMVPYAFDLPASAAAIDLYVHDTNPGGPVEACDDWDSLGGQNYRFGVAGGLAPGDDGLSATPDDLAQRIDIGDGARHAALLFGSSGAPVVRGHIVGGGKVTVAYALDRMKTCRAWHDGWPFWDTRFGGEIDDASGTSVALLGERGPAAPSGHVGGSLVSFNTTDPSSNAAKLVPNTFDVPAGAKRVVLYAHNTNPGGPVEACDDWDSLRGANYSFPVE